MRGGSAKLPNALAELLCRGDELGAVDGALLVHTVGADHAAFFAAIVAVEESAQGGKRTIELVAVCVCHREDVVEPLVREIRIDDHRAVDERLELGADRVEIDGRGEDDDVRRHHLVDDLLRIVLDRALAGLLAGVATGAVADLECGDAHLFDFVPRCLRAIGKCVAEDVRVPALAWRGRDDQYFLAHMSIPSDMFTRFAYNSFAFSTSRLPSARALAMSVAK